MQDSLIQLSQGLPVCGSTPSHPCLRLSLPSGVPKQLACSPQRDGFPVLTPREVIQLIYAAIESNNGDPSLTADILTLLHCNTAPDSWTPVHCMQKPTPPGRLGPLPPSIGDVYLAGAPTCFICSPCTLASQQAWRLGVASLLAWELTQVLNLG